MPQFKDKREELMQRTKAARLYTNQCTGFGDHKEQLEMAAFLDIFHPEMSAEKKRELILSQRKKS